MNKSIIYVILFVCLTLIMLSNSASAAFYANPVTSVNIISPEEFMPNSIYYVEIEYSVDDVLDWGANEPAKNPTIKMLVTNAKIMGSINGDFSYDDFSQTFSINGKIEEKQNKTAVLVIETLDSGSVTIEALSTCEDVDNTGTKIQSDYSIVIPIKEINTKSSEYYKQLAEYRKYLFEEYLKQLNNIMSTTTTSEWNDLSRSGFQQANLDVVSICANMIVQEATSSVASGVGSVAFSYAVHGNIAYASDYYGYVDTLIDINDGYNDDEMAKFMKWIAWSEENILNLIGKDIQKRDIKYKYGGSKNPVADMEQYITLIDEEINCWNSQDYNKLKSILEQERACLAYKDQHGTYYNYNRYSYVGETYYTKNEDEQLYIRTLFGTVGNAVNADRTLIEDSIIPILGQPNIVFQNSIPDHMCIDEEYELIFRVKNVGSHADEFLLNIEASNGLKITEEPLAESLKSDNTIRVYEPWFSSGDEHVLKIKVKPTQSGNQWIKYYAMTNPVLEDFNERIFPLSGYHQESILVDNTPEYKTGSGIITVTPTKTSLRIETAFSGDSDNDGTAQIYYKESSSETWLSSPHSPDKKNKMFSTEISGLAENTIYELKVIYSDPDGIVGPAEIYKSSVKTGNSLPAPNLYNFDSGDTDGSYYLDWNYVPDTTYYEIQESTSNIFSSTPFTSYEHGMYLTGKQSANYYYRVRACNQFGSSEWSNVVSITVNLDEIADNSYSGILIDKHSIPNANDVKEYVYGDYKVTIIDRWYLDTDTPRKARANIYNNGNIQSQTLIEGEPYYFEDLQVLLIAGDIDKIPGQGDQTFGGYHEQISVCTKTTSEVSANPNHLYLSPGDTSFISLLFPREVQYDFYFKGDAKDWAVKEDNKKVGIKIPSNAAYGNYQLSIFANTGSDGEPAYSIKDIAITIQENIPFALAEIGDKSIQEKELLTFTISATNPGEGPVTYSAEGLPRGAELSSSGKFTWTPGSGAAGVYTVKFIATLNGQTDFETIKITVNKVIDNPPELAYIGDKLVYEGEELSFRISANDPDGDKITYSVQGLPNGAELSSSGLINWFYKSSTFTWTPDSGTAGKYPVKFIATADSLTDEETVIITVNKVDDNPPIANAGADQSATIGSAVSFDGSASADDKGIASYSWDFDAVDGVNSESTGKTATKMYNTAGTYTVTLTVTDTSGQQSLDTLKVFVSDLAEPISPTVIDSTPKTNDVPLNSQIAVTFSEPMDQASVQSAFLTSPATTGSFSWNGNTMTYTPSSSLGYSTSYTVNVGTGAKDIDGNSLKSSYKWQFTTTSEGPISPTVIDSTPKTNDVPLNSQIAVTFSEPMDQASVQSAFLTSPATTGSFSWNGNTMTYTPSSSLGYSTSYTVNVGTGAKDIDGNSLKSLYRWQFTTTSEGPISPTVIDGTPKTNDVPVNSQIAVTFSEPMDQTSVQSAFLTSPVTTGSFSWNGNTMTYTPSSSLGYSTSYNVNVGTGAKDLDGNSLKSSYKWQFTTTSEGPISPTVIDGTPKTNDVSVNSQIAVTFSEPMDQTSVQSAFLTSPVTTGSFSWNGNTMTYTPSSSLGYSTSYTVNVGTGAKDLDGNSLKSSYKWQFTTTSEGTISPTVIDGTPKTNDVSVNSQIAVTFSKPMDQTSVQSAFLTSPVTTGSFSWNGNTMTYTPSSSLGYSTSYTVNVGTGAKDLDGNSLESSYDWQFSTESDSVSDNGDASEHTILFEDDFESYETGSYPGSPWQILFSGNNGYVTDEKAYSGAKSYKAQGMNGWSRNDIVSLDTIDKVGYEIAICPQGQDTRVCLYNRDVGSWGSHDASVSFGADGKAYAGDQVILDSYDTNQWYLVRVEVDFEKWLMDVYINGELVATDVSALAEYPTSGGARYNCLNLESLWESDPGIYYDSIKVFRLDEV